MANKGMDGNLGTRIFIPRYYHTNKTGSQNIKELIWSFQLSKSRCIQGEGNNLFCEQINWLHISLLPILEFIYGTFIYFIYITNATAFLVKWKIFLQFKTNFNMSKFIIQL